jgi:hypothetical protein
VSCGSLCGCASVWLCASCVQDTCFVVEVPSPAAGYAEYVVPRARFDFSVLVVPWKVGHQCQVRSGGRKLMFFADSIQEGRSGASACVTAGSHAWCPTLGRAGLRAELCADMCCALS